MGCNPSNENSEYARSILKKDKLLKLMDKTKKSSGHDKFVRDETEFVKDVFRLDFRHEWVVQFLEIVASKHRLGSVPTLALRYLPETEAHVPEFFEMCVDEIENLFINNYVTKERKESKLEIEPYFSAITSVIPKVKSTLWVEYFELSSRQMAQIIRKGCHLKSVRFEFCSIDFSDIKNKKKTVTLHTENDNHIEYLGFKG